METKQYEQMYCQQQPIQTQLALELERITEILQGKSEEYDQQKNYIKEIEILSKQIKDSEFELKELTIRENNQRISINELSKENNHFTEKFMNEFNNKNDEFQKLQSIIQKQMMLRKYKNQNKRMLFNKMKQKGQAIQLK